MTFTGSGLEQNDPKKMEVGGVGGQSMAVCNSYGPAPSNINRDSVVGRVWSFGRLRPGSWAQRSCLFPAPSLVPAVAFLSQELDGSRNTREDGLYPSKGVMSPQCCTVDNRALTALVWLPRPVTMT